MGSLLKSNKACFRLSKKNTKVMMNRRADGENGSSVKSPNQDAVIGQIFLSSFYKHCDRSSWCLEQWCPLKHDSIKVVSVLTILQFADRSEDQK